VARTIPYSAGSTIQPVVAAAAEHAEIYDQRNADAEGATMGRAPLALTVNGLDEQKRGALVADYDPDRILKNVGDIAHWRGKVMGHRDVGHETADVWLWLTAVDGGDSDPTSAQVNVKSVSAGGAVGWNYSVDLVTITKVHLMTIDVIDDATVFEEFNAELVSEGAEGNVDVRVFGVDIVYERKKTAIGAGEYANGQTSQDLTSWDGEKPVSAARDRDKAGNLVAMYQERVGQITSAAMPDGLSNKVPGGISRGTVLGTTPPQDVTSAAFHLLLDAGDGAKTVVITGADSSLVLTPVAGGWYSGNLTVVAENPQRIEIASPTLEIRSICAWWNDASIPGGA